MVPQARAPSYVGIDLGTSSVKLLLLDAAVGVVRTVTRSLTLDHPQAGWSEQHPEDWYRATVDGLGELLDGIDPSLVRSLGISGQMHGLVALDSGDRVLRPAILWNDGRSDGAAAALNDASGSLVAATANIAFPGFTAPKLLWMKAHEPALFAGIRKVMLPKDYLVHRLTGEYTTDPSDASGTLLFDVARRCWSADMLASCVPAEVRMPAVVDGHAVAGRLRPEVAAELGLSPEVTVVGGAADNAAAAIGTGAVGAGASNVSIGTSGTVLVETAEFVPLANHAVHNFAHTAGGWFFLGCMLSAAACYQWWLDSILRSDGYLAEQDGIDLRRPNEVVFAPYLSGERSPHNDADVRGAFLGLSVRSQRSDLTRAVLEGVAFGLRDSVEVMRAEGVPVTSSRITGGGARSPLWRRLVANVLNVDLEVPAAEEGPALGAAMLAAVGDGAYPTLAEAAAALVTVAEVIRPEPDLVAAYDAAYQRFRGVYPRLSQFPPIPATRPAAGAPARDRVADHDVDTGTDHVVPAAINQPSK